MKRRPRAILPRIWTVIPIVLIGLAAISTSSASQTVDMAEVIDFASISGAIAGKATACTHDDGSAFTRRFIATLKPYQLDPSDNALALLAFAHSFFTGLFWQSDPLRSGSEPCASVLKRYELHPLFVDPPTPEAGETRP